MQPRSQYFFSLCSWVPSKPEAKLKILGTMPAFEILNIGGHAKQTICAHKIQGPYEPNSERSIRVNGSLPKNIPSVLTSRFLNVDPVH